MKTGIQHIILLSLTCCSLSLQAQTRVYLERCESLNYDEQRLPDAQILRGNVVFRHDEALMYCDSAYFYEASNSLRAFGHVRFNQGDTLQGFGDMLYYNGNTKKARLRHHVRLLHRTTTLTTDSLDYDRNQDLAFYRTGGTIKDSLNTLTSVWGQYRPNLNEALFQQDVHLDHPSFVLDADSLKYNTKTYVATLIAPTTIVYEEETTILSDNGTYNTSSEQSHLFDRSQVIHNDGKRMTGDTIFYDKKRGNGRVKGHFVMADTVQKATLYGDYGEYYEADSRGMATDSAMLVDWSKEDTMFIHADTLYTEQIPYTDTLIVRADSLPNDTILKDTTFRQMRAFHNVRAYSEEYQMVCDSVSYNGRDSVAHLYGMPLCWNYGQQVSADSIFVYFKDSTIDYAHGLSGTMVIKQEAHGFFNQMAGKEMKAYVRDGELAQVNVSGNAETVFYPTEDDGTFIGLNRSQSSAITIFLENQKVQKVLFTTTTTGTLYPLDQVDDSQSYLVGFFWAEQERPRSKDDIFLHPERTKRPEQQMVSAVEEEPQEEEETAPKPKRNRKKHQQLL